MMIIKTPKPLMLYTCTIIYNDKITVSHEHHILKMSPNSIREVYNLSKKNILTTA